MTWKDVVNEIIKTKHLDSDTDKVKNQVAYLGKYIESLENQIKGKSQGTIEEIELLKNQNEKLNNALEIERSTHSNYVSNIYLKEENKRLKKIITEVNYHLINYAVSPLMKSFNKKEMRQIMRNIDEDKN
jgi:hypothetical protein